MSRAGAPAANSQVLETIEQQTFLRDQACDEMQGYYFSKPIAATEFATLLRSNAPPTSGVG